MLDVLFGDGPPAATTYAFVNVTRSFLVDDRPLPAHAGRLVLEIVESVAADDEVLAGLAAAAARAGTASRSTTSRPSRTRWR